MSALLARLRDRPIADSERRAALTLATVLLLAWAAFLLASRPGSAPLPPRHREAAARTVRTPDPPPAADPPTSEPSSALARLSREFLAGYLAYLYGHAGASGIRGASPTLASALSAHPPRVSLDTRARAPRVVSLHAAMSLHGQLTATAMISDGGVAEYPVILLIEHRGRRLVVSGLGER